MYLFVVLIEGSKDLGERKFTCFNQETSFFFRSFTRNLRRYAQDLIQVLISTLFGHKLLPRNYCVKNGNGILARREIVKFLFIWRELEYHMN